MIINIDRSNLLADIEYRPRQTIICLCVIGDRDKEWVTLFNCGIQVPRTGERERERTETTWPVSMEKVYQSFRLQHFQAAPI